MQSQVREVQRLLGKKTLSRRRLNTPRGCQAFGAWRATICRLDNQYSSIEEAPGFGRKITQRARGRRHVNAIDDQARISEQRFGGVSETS